MAGFSTRTRLDVTPRRIARMLDHPLTLLAARCCIALPFLVAGITKLIAWDAGEAEMQAVGLHPAWVFNAAALVTELGGAAAIILNRAVWLGAGALGVFTLLATLLAHQFWALRGVERLHQLNSFCEHAAICAGFILVTVMSPRQRER